MGAPPWPGDGKFAVAFGDLSRCGDKSHATAWCGYSETPVVATCTVRYTAKGLAIAVVGDSTTCQKGATDYIVTGVSTVWAQGKMIARHNSRTLHMQGYVQGTATDIIVDGPMEGALFGSDKSPECEDAQKTRHDPKDPTKVAPNASQSYFGNCAAEQVRMQLNKGKHPGDPGYITEDEMVKRVQKQYPGWDPRSDGMSSEEIRRILQREQGGGPDWSPSNSKPKTDVKGPEAPTARDVDIQESLIRGKQPIVGVNAPLFWEKSDPYATPMRDQPGHAIGIVGVKYDADGKVKGYYVNDTGKGDCAKLVPPDAIHYGATDGPMLGK